jgi:hypothetical protein
MRILNVLGQPARQAFLVIVDYVIPQSAYDAVDASPFADKTAVILRVSAIDNPHYP